MENLTALVYALVAGLLLVTIMYLAYILIPLLILVSVVSIVFYLNKAPATPMSNTGGSIKVNW